MKNQVLLLNEIRDQLKSVLKNLDDINTSSCVINVSMSDSIDVEYLKDIQETFKKRFTGLNEDLWDLAVNGPNSLKNTAPINFKSVRGYNGGLHFYDFFPFDIPKIGDKIKTNDGIILEIIDQPTQVSDKGYCFGVKKIIGHGNI